ncbi:MAG: hypothetical protein ACTSUE_01870 [Promethearchaeota archaeon]
MAENESKSTEEEREEIKKLGLETASKDGFSRLMEHRKKEEKKKPEFRGF